MANKSNRVKSHLWHYLHLNHAKREMSKRQVYNSHKNHIVFTNPVVRDRKGDVTKPWYVEFYVKEGNGQWVRFQESEGINKPGNDTYNKKCQAANLLKNVIFELLSEGQTPTNQPQASLNLNQLLDKAPNCLHIDRHRSKQTYQSTIKKFQEYVNANGLSQYQPNQIGKAGALQYLEYLSQVNSNRDANNKKQQLRAVFNKLIDYGYCQVNPFQNIKDFRQDRGKNIAFSDEQVQELMQYMNDHCPNLNLVCRFVYYTFIRPYELMLLQVGDVFLKEGKIRVRSEQSKNRDQNFIVIHNDLWPQLSALTLDAYPSDYYLFSKNFEPGPTKIGRNEFTRQFKKVLTALNYPGHYTLYSWKHTGVVKFVQNGANIYDVMNQLRHANLGTTQKYLKSLGFEVSKDFGKIKLS